MFEVLISNHTKENEGTRVRTSGLMMQGLAVGIAHSQPMHHETARPGQVLGSPVNSHLILAVRS